MCDRMLDSVCRLCLTENFTHISVFTKSSPSGEFVYQVLNFIYGLKIFEGDGLPSKICVPCLWRMLEFHTYKKNVNYADLEIKKLLEKIRSNSHEVSREQAIDNDVLEEEELPMNDVSDVGDARDNVNETEASTKKEIDIEEWTVPEEIQPEKDNLEVSVKDEIDIVEWEIPNDLQSKVDIEEERCSDRQFSLEEVRNSIDNGLESSKVITSTMDLEEKEGVLRNEIVKQMKISLGVEAEQKEEESIERNKEAYDLLSSETCEAIISECVRDRNESAEIIENGSSVVSNSENKDASEGIMQEDVLNDGNEEEESFDALMLESSDNFSESGTSRSVTPVKRKKQDFVCDICKKSYVYKSELGRHVRVHYNDRPFKCNKCGKGFKQDIGRRAHELIHLRNENRKKENDNASKAYSCDICAKKFKYKSSLLGHSNVHKNKYKCRNCGKSYDCNSHLNVHLRRHTNEKPFSCKVCKMSFTVKGNLKAHLATHSDDRPFQCNVCHKRFKSQRNKHQHELLHLRSN